MADFTGIDLFGEIYDADDANAVQQSQVVPTVDSDSDDDHIPTAKAVFDAIVSGQIPAFHYEEFELPENCTSLDMDINWIDATDDQSEHYTIAPDANYPLNAIRITGLNNVDVSFTWDGFPYDGKPSDWTDIGDLMMVSTPTDCYIYVQVLIYSSGGLSFSDYMRFRILSHEASASAMGADLPKYARVWDDLTMHPEVNASGNIDKIVLNGTERAIEDPNAADQTLSNLSDAATARANLGLGTAATRVAISTYTETAANTNILDALAIRRANTYNTEQYVTYSAGSITGTNLYRKVFRSSTSVAAGANLTLDSMTPYTDVVAMYASGRDAFGNYHSIECFTDPDWCIKNTSGTTLVEVTLVALYSKP